MFFFYNFFIYNIKHVTIIILLVDFHIPGSAVDIRRSPHLITHYCYVYSRAAACKPMKTLQEREAAYAEARLRIMGSADSGSTSEQTQESR